MDSEDSVFPTLTRRRALAGAGALAAGVGTGAATMSGLFDRDTPYRRPWVARNNYFFQNGESRRDSNFAISANTYLQYVDASWERFGDPSGDGGGCWEHTFMLYSTAFAVHPRRYRGADASPPVPDSVDYVPATGQGANVRDSWSQNIDLGSELTVKSEQNHQAVSVSARRDGDLYQFIDPDQLTTMVENNPEMANAHSYGPTGTSDYEDLLASTPGTDVNWAEARMKERAEDGEAYLKAGMTTLGLALTATGALAPLGTALLAAGTVRGFLTLLLNNEDSPEDGVSYKRGFENSNPKTGACTGHLVMFDVCVSPGQRGTFSVESTHPHDLGISPIEPKWEIDLPAIEAPDDDERDRRPFHASILPPANSKTTVQTDPTPSIDIGPAPERRTQGTELSFSGVDTLRGGAMTRSFDWEVFQYSGDPTAPVGASTGVSPSGPTFQHTFAPGAYVAELSVTDETGATGTARKPFEVGADTAGPEARLSATPSTIEINEGEWYDDLPDITFDATASSDDLGIVQHEWRVPTMGTQRAYGRPTTLRVPTSAEFVSDTEVTGEVEVWDRAGRSSTASATVTFEGGDE